MYAAKTSKFESLKMCKLIAIYYGQKIISILAQIALMALNLFQKTDSKVHCS